MEKSNPAVSRKTCLIALAIVFLTTLASPAIAAVVTGKVTDAKDGQAMIGVNVRVKGTSRGAITDLDGHYTVDAGQGETLIFSYIGYQTLEYQVGNDSRLDVAMKENDKTLDDVVVIGYGSTRRKDVTGSISSISADEIMKSQPVTIEQALQGKVAGLVVQQISGQPGGAVSLQVHGLSSFSGGAPLWIVDGIKMNGGATLGSGVNPLAGINPSDIESIDVLKDASATAIYGSEATNGVIVVTTKRGKVAPPTITYDAYAGFQQLGKKLPVMNLKEFATFVNDRNTGIGWGFDERPEFANPEYLGEGTNWQDVLFRNAAMQNHSLSLSGGDTRTKYFLSGGYLKQNGIAEGSDFSRTSLRVNLDNQTTNWLKMGIDVQLGYIKENITSSSSNVIRTALTQTPDIAVQNSDGSWGGAYNEDGWVQQVANPFALAKINKDVAKRYQFWGNMYQEARIYKGLTFRNEITGGFTVAKQECFYPTYKMGLIEKTTNSGSYRSAQSYNIRISDYFTFTHQFKEILNLNLMAGHEAQISGNDNVFASRELFPSNNVQVISGGDATTAKNDGTKGKNALESYFGRANANFLDKYLLTVNLRRDGSSKYIDKNRWVTTYSFAAAWRLSNEKLLKNIKAIDNIKLRLGYGLTNNPGGRDFAYTTVLSTVPNSLSGVSQLTSKLGNPMLGWEKTKNGNIGLDLSLFNYRVNLTVDFYNRKTDGLIMQTYLPDYSATSIGWAPGAMDAPYVNIGSVRNRGFDIKISTRNIMTKNFSWTSDLTISHNKNKVLKLNTEDASIKGTYSKTVVGRSIGEFYGYKFDGLYSNPVDFLGDEAKGIKPHARPARNGEPIPVGTAYGSIWYGDRMFKDIVEDGIIDERDQTFLGSPLPKVQLGFNNTFSYRHFDLNVFFSANIGNKVFNEMRIAGESPASSTAYLKVLSEHARLGLIDPDGSDTDINNVYVINPGTRIVGVRNDDTNDNDRVSDIYVEDGSFLRCKTLSLGYTFPETLFRKLPIKTLRIYASVSNLFLITKYKGMDPEIGSWDPVNAGVDSGYYPQPRVYTIGLNISLNK